MTEKEFLLKLVSMDMETEDEIRDICKEALRLAKEHGAKFEPEPAIVDLPDLRAFQLGRTGYDIRLKNARPEGFDTTYLLTLSQAKEVVYRCKKWNLIRKIVTSMASRDENPGKYAVLLTVLNTR